MSQTDPMSRAERLQCSATSKQTGKRCGQKAILGGTVCMWHGGAAPQTLQRARERLAALVDPAIARLGQLLQEQDHKQVALAAARDILDRNSLVGAKQVEISGPEGGPIPIATIARVIVDVRTGEDG
jgi:hypothetical protein